MKSRETLHKYLAGSAFAAAQVGIFYHLVSRGVNRVCLPSVGCYDFSEKSANALPAQPEQVNQKTTVKMQR